MTRWKLKEWNKYYSNITLPMTKKEIDEAIEFLHKNYYPKPIDCPGQKCLGFRPACNLGICFIAIKMCEDF